MDKIKKLAISDINLSEDLNDVSQEIEHLLDAEMKAAEGGCWKCDSYCEKCVTNK